MKNIHNKKRCVQKLGIASLLTLGLTIDPYFELLRPNLRRLN